MKIPFTKKEYRILLEMVCLSDWLINARVCDSEDYNLEHTALRKKLFSYSKEMDAEDIVDYDPGLNDFFETRAFEENLHEQFIDPYEEDVFWEELAFRLARRDLYLQLGEEKLNAMDRGDIFVRTERIKEQYDEEFEGHGINRIKIEHAKVGCG